MADTKISALTPITPVVGTQLIPISTVGLLNGSITPAGILSYGTSPVAGTTGTFTGNIAAGATGGFALFSNTAGAGPSITAGTAASAVSALNITQTIGINAGNAALATASPFGIQWTWNDINAATGVKWVVTDTSSAAGALPFQILGGAAGTLNLLSIGKSSTGASLLTVGSSTGANVGIILGSVLSGYSGIWSTYNGTPTISNQRLLFESATTYLSATGVIILYDNTNSKEMLRATASASAPLVALPSNSIFGFTSGVASAALDTGFSRLGAASVALGNGTAADFSGGLKLTDLTINRAATFLTTSVALTNGAGASAGTITNAPAVGNPTKWIGINDNGTTRYIPAW